jgi:hypothetical protein
VEKHENPKPRKRVSQTRTFGPLAVKNIGSRPFELMSPKLDREDRLLEMIS